MQCILAGIILYLNTKNFNTLNEYVVVNTRQTFLFVKIRPIKLQLPFY